MENSSNGKGSRPGHAGSSAGVRASWSEGQGRAVVAERSQGRCEAAIPGVCLGRAQNVHHRRNRSQGGTWSPDNLLHLCGSGTTGCHGWIGREPASASLLGLTLHRGDTAAIPVRLLGSVNGPGWYVLREDWSEWLAPGSAVL